MNFLDDFLGSITAEIRENIGMLTSGNEDSIQLLASLLENKYSVSVSGLVITGNEHFTSVQSYTGPFLSMSGSVSNIKGGIAVSDSCIAFSLGAISSAAPSWGLSLTNYSLRGTMSISKGSGQLSQKSL